MIKGKVKEEKRFYYNLDKVLWFGKYKGKTIRWVIEVCPSYIGFCLRKIYGFCLDLEAEIYYNKHKVDIAELTYGEDDYGMEDECFMDAYGSWESPGFFMGM